MILSDLSPRGTLHGVIVRGGGGGVTDYDDLTNRPQINGHLLTGNQSAEDLGLAEPEDIKFTGINQAAGWSIYRCRNITVGGLVYNVAYPEFTGTDGVDPGTNGLVKCPEPTDLGKFLSASGGWEAISGFPEVEVREITNGSGTTSRAFQFDKTPKFIKIFHKSASLAFYSDVSIVWGQTFYTYPSHGTFIEITGGTVPSGQITYNDNEITFTAGNAFGAFNVSDSEGFMFIVY